MITRCLAHSLNTRDDRRKRVPTRTRRATLLVLVSLGMLTMTTAALGAAAPTIQGGPTGTTNNPPSFTITGDPTGTVTWILLLNGGQVNGGSGLGSVDTGPLDNGDGPYVLTASQTVPDDPIGDPVGVPSDPASVGFTLDRVAPATPTFTQLPPALLNATSATFNWINDGSAFQWQISGGADQTSGSGAGPVTITGLASGSHTFSVTPTDAAGNTGATASFGFSVDAAAPGAPAITPIANNLTNVATQTMTWAPTEAGGSFTWQLAGPSPLGPLATGVASTGALALLAGTHTLTVQHIDAALNASAVASYTFTIDTALPTGGAIAHVPTAPALSGFARSTNVNVNLTAVSVDTIDGTTAAAGAITYAVTATPTAPAAATFTAWTVTTPTRSVAVPNTQGPTTIFLWARDAAGNISAALPLAPAVVFDTVRPTVAATSLPVPGVNVTTNFGTLANVTVDFSEPVQDPVSRIRMCRNLCGSPIAAEVTFDALQTAQKAILNPFPLSPTQPLVTGTQYEIQLLSDVLDRAGNALNGIGSTSDWTFITSTDGTPPGPIAALGLSPGIGQIALSWTVPGDPDLARITVLRNTSPPVSAADAAVARFSLPASATSFTDIGLAPGVTYHYAVYAEDAVGNPSELVRSSAVPLAPPPIVLTGTPAVTPVASKPPATYRANLMKPRKGAVLKTLRPRLNWKPVKGATIYNIQVFDGKRKVVSAFTKARVYRVPKNRLKRGRRLTWHVWAYLGAKRKFVPRPMTSWFDTSKKAKA